MDKVTLTKLIIQEAKLDTTADQAYRQWWWPTNSNNKDHKRLTAPGKNALTGIMPAYDFDFRFDNSPRQLKMLSKLDTPYYVDYHGITVFSSKIASMVKLYGTFDRYLELLQND